MNEDEPDGAQAVSLPDDPHRLNSAFAGIAPAQYLRREKVEPVAQIERNEGLTAFRRERANVSADLGPGGNPAPLLTVPQRSAIGIVVKSRRPHSRGLLVPDIQDATTPTCLPPEADQATEIAMGGLFVNRKGVPRISLHHGRF